MNKYKIYTEHINYIRTIILLIRVSCLMYDGYIREWRSKSLTATLTYSLIAQSSLAARE